MNKHQEHHHDMLRQDHLENPAQTDISTGGASEKNDRESEMDELENMMFDRAR